MKTDENKRELLTRLIQGDTHAFDALYYRYHRDIFANALKISKSKIIAEEVVQETFVTLWVKRATIDIDKDIGGWLFRVSYNKAIDYLRKISDEQYFENDLSKLESEISSKNEAQNQELRWQILEKAIDKLSPRKQEVIRLCKFQGKTYRQAAKEMGISKHTVKEYLTESMAFIKDYARKHAEQNLPLILLFLLKNNF